MEISEINFEYVDDSRYPPYLIVTDWHGKNKMLVNDKIEANHIATEIFNG